MSKKKGKSLEVSTESSEPIITFGTEVERYTVELSEEQKQKYKDQLDKAVKAHAINSLDLDQIFSKKAAKKASLCIIKKDGIRFMEVLFDDNVKMTQLEFISIPDQDLETGQYTGGVKKIRGIFYS